MSKAQVIKGQRGDKLVQHVVQFSEIDLNDTTKFRVPVDHTL